MKYWMIQAEKDCMVVESKTKSGARKKGFDKFGRGGAAIWQITEDEYNSYKGQKQAGLI